MKEVLKERKTKETEIKISLNPRGSGIGEIKTDSKFFTHMLELFKAHGNFDLEIDAKSLDSDMHHLVEDTAITLGQAFFEALEDKKGIKRYGNMILPMDEALILCSLDISGRASFCSDVKIKEDRTSDFETVLFSHFFQSFTQNAQITLHFKMLEGSDPHHIIECAFKSFARALREAISEDKDNPNKIPSTKGVL